MSIFLCLNCSNEYNKINKKPRSLPCGHIFCEECVSSFIQKDIKGNYIICPLDKKIHRNLNLPNIPICVQILENLPFDFNSNNENEITNYINEVENKIKIIQKQINSYKKVEQGIIDYFNDEIKKINKFFDSIIIEIQKKKNSILERITNIFKEQNMKIERNRKVILDYTLKLDEIIKTYESMTDKINFEEFLKEKKKTDKDLNTIISFINNNIVIEAKNQNYPFYFIPKEISIPKNIIGELKIINNYNTRNNNELYEENTLNETESEIGNVTNIFNQNLYNEIKKLNTPNKQDNSYYKPFYYPNDINRNVLNLNEKFNVVNEYDDINKRINETDKIPNRKRVLTAREEKKISNLSLPKKKNSKRKNSLNENEYLHYYSQLNTETEKRKNHSKKTSSIKKKLIEHKEIIKNSNFRLYKEKNPRSSAESKRETIHQYKKGYISTETDNNNYKKSKKKNSFEAKKLLIHQKIKNVKKSISPIANHQRINNNYYNNKKIVSSKSYRNYNTEVSDD